VLAGIDTAFCRACGLRQADSDGTCSECGWELRRPEEAPSRLGVVVKVPGRLRARPGICVTDDGAATAVHLSAKDQVTLQATEFDALERVEVATVTTSIAFRFYNASNGVVGVKHKWDTTMLTDIAGQIAASSMSSMRLSARDALQVERPEVFQTLTLSQGEKLWLQARQAAANRQAAETLELLNALPPNRYVGRVALVAHLAPVIRLDPALTALAVAMLHQFPDDEEANVVARYLRGATTAELSHGDIEWAGARLATLGSPDGARLAELAAAMRQGGTAEPPATSGYELTRAWTRYLQGMAGHDLSAHVTDLAPLPLSLIDDVLDAGSLPSADLASCGRDPAETAYLVTRQDAGRAPAGFVYQAEHWVEFARRSYLANDDSTLRMLPSSPEIVHYESMLELRRKGKTNVEKLSPALRQRVVELTDFCASAAQPDRPDVPPWIGTDRTVWPLLADVARNGTLALRDDERRAYPLLADWIDLQRLLQTIWDGDWSGATMRATQLIPNLTTEQERDEAQNLQAFAEYQSGQLDRALDTLESALLGAYSDALLVNASVVASEVGSMRAGKFFARIVSEAPSDDVRLAALKQAVNVWSNDEDAEFPPELYEPVREVIQSSVQEADFIMFARLESTIDRDWFGSAAVLDAVPYAHHPAMTLYRARARFFSERSDDGPTELATALADVVPRTDRASWAQMELNGFVDFLLAAVHVDFGEAAYLSAAIERLTAVDGLLDFHIACILSVQAGAHLARFFGEQGNVLNPASEHRLLWSWHDRFVQQRPSLEPGLAAAMEEELAVCLTTGGIGLMIGLEANWSAVADEYNAINQRLQYAAPAMQFQLVAEKRRLLGVLESENVERVRAYAQRLAKINLNDAQQGFYRDMLSTLRDWENEIMTLRRGL
jgi:hypothetical protein